jgi:hypothetical protein
MTEENWKKLRLEFGATPLVCSPVQDIHVLSEFRFSFLISFLFHLKLPKLNELVLIFVSSSLKEVQNML